MYDEAGPPGMTRRGRGTGKGGWLWEGLENKYLEFTAVGFLFFFFSPLPISEKRIMGRRCGDS